MPSASHRRSSGHSPGSSLGVSQGTAVNLRIPVLGLGESQGTGSVVYHHQQAGAAALGILYDLSWGMQGLGLGADNTSR